MSGHTPGPWRVIIDDTGDRWTGWPRSIGCVDPDKSIVRPGGVYPYDWDAGMSQKEAVANARLIAAAPELLEVVRGFMGDDENGFDVAIGGNPIVVNEFLSRARAAIAKATGK